MLDYNILKWNWSQRFLLVAYILMVRHYVKFPYARVSNEIMRKDFGINLLGIAMIITVTIGALRCYGYYRIQYKKTFYTALGIKGAYILFLIIAYTRDKRLPTIHLFIAFALTFIVYFFIWYDTSNYVYEER